MRRGALWSLLMLAAWRAEAATVTAASCSRSDVGDAVMRAAPGDEVRIPPGTCAWQQTLELSKPVTLSGSGEAATVLRDDVPKDVDPAHLIWVSGGDGTRLTGFTVEGLRPDTVRNNRGHVALSGTTRGFRIDHLAFRDTVTAGVRINGSVVGVIDHCTFDYGFNGGIDVFHDEWGGALWGDGSWASPSSFGTADVVVVEDCRFSPQSGGAPAVTASGGARVAVRRCDIRGATVFAVGVDTSGRFRAARHVEVYENDFSHDGGVGALFVAIAVEGGTGVVFGNSVSNAWGALLNVDVKRAAGSHPPWGRCDGSSPFDENSNASGYACLDMVGRGAGALVQGDTPMPAAWPQQALEPLYVWGNDFDGSTLVLNRAAQVISEGRDVIIGSPRPGYVSFPYPHPLVRGVSDGGLSPRWNVVGCGCASAVEPLAALSLLLALCKGRRRPRE